MAHTRIVFDYQYFVVEIHENASKNKFLYIILTYSDLKLCKKDVKIECKYTNMTLYVK